ncbi:MAG: NAD(P)-dependent oxidoreductase [Candidatus Ratteibacteria bacterium]|nr:NAD(P)-dependent oxidoreductase [Candidatus Ratteibacteria bacterium]
MKILIAVHPFLLDIPEIKNIDFINNPWGRKPSADDLEKELVTGKYDGLIVGTTEVKKSIVEKVNSLKVISRVGVGVDNVDVEFFKKHGVLTTNTPFGLTNSAAEMAVALILAGMRRLVNYNNMVKNNKRWDRKIGLSLADATIGIVGYGNIGKRVAFLLKAFDGNIILSDAKPDFITAQAMGLKFVGKKELLEKSDIITLHVPLDESSIDWLSFEELKNLKKPVVIVNTARGGIVNEQAIYEYLKNHNDSYYCCDVYVSEPYNGKLIELENVLLTPHISTCTLSSRRQAEQLAIENCLKILSGKSCNNIVKNN